MVVEHWIESDSLRLRVLEDGEPENPTVLLVHGWPDTADLWRNQIPAFVESGYRVLALDQRGFGQSDIPASVRESHVLKAMGDLVALLDHFKVDRAHVVGHDWGATVAWLLAMMHPDRVRSLIALSVGHPNAYRRAGLDQLQQSFYMLLFQFEGVAEEWLSADDYLNFRALVGNSTENVRHVANMDRPGRLTASLNWYRANMAPATLVAPEPDLPPVLAPTLGVIGSEDTVMGETQMRLSAEFVDAPFEYVVLNNRGHWLPSDAVDQLNPLLLGWLHAQG